MKQKYAIDITNHLPLPPFVFGLLRDIGVEKKFGKLSTREIFKALKRKKLFN